MRDVYTRMFVRHRQRTRPPSSRSQERPKMHQVFSWGSGRNGQLGLGHTEDRPFPCPVEGLQGVDIEAVFCGVFHSMAICSLGAPYAWGKNSSGQCGRKDLVTLDTVSTPRVLLTATYRLSGCGFLWMPTGSRQVKKVHMILYHSHTPPA